MRRIPRCRKRCVECWHLSKEENVKHQELTIEWDGGDRDLTKGGLASPMAALDRRRKGNL